MSMDSDSQQQEAALPRVVVRRSFSRYALLHRMEKCLRKTLTGHGLKSNVVF